MGLFVRPPSEQRPGGNYGTVLLERANPRGERLHVDNLCRESETVGTLLSDIYSRIFVHSPHVVIVQLGINECVPRLLPRWAFSRISGIHLNDGRVVRLVRSLTAGILNRQIGPYAIRWLHLGPWYSRKRFHRQYGRLLDILAKEFSPRVIAIGINPTSARVESLLPGSSRNIALFNEIIREQTIAHHGVFLDPAELWEAGQEEAMVPDGIHFSFSGHSRVAEAIASILEKEKDCARAGI